MPALAVIVRTLGRPRLGEALESLAQQTSRDFEAVVVDMSGGLANAIIAAAAPRLPALRHLPVRRLNRPAALNYGIASSSAPAIAILDDDNLYGPEHVQTLVCGLREDALDLVYTAIRRQAFTPDGQFVEEQEWHSPVDVSRLLFDNYIFATSTAFTRDIWTRVGGYDVRFPVFEDWEFLVRVAAAGRIAAIEGRGAISRSFTGNIAIPEHTREAGDCARCATGLFWTHRRRYTDTLFRDRPDLVSRYPHVPCRGVYLGLHVLASWWWHGVVHRLRSRV